MLHFVILNLIYQAFYTKTYAAMWCIDRNLYFFEEINFKDIFKLKKINRTAFIRLIIVIL